jgi:hypothetical protein
METWNAAGCRSAFAVLMAPRRICSKQNGIFEKPYRSQCAGTQSLDEPFS